MNYIFKDANGEEVATKTLKAFCDEFNPENVTVRVPSCWSEYRDSYVKQFYPANLLFTTNNTIEFEARSGAKFSIELSRVN
jgi:hypothetical protein